MIQLLNRSCLQAGMVLGSILMLMPQAEAGTTFYSDRPTWEADLVARGMTVVNFSFTAENIAKAAEVLSPPAPGTQLGPSLTFSSAETGLPSTWQLRALEPGSGLIWQPTITPIGPNTINIDSDGTGNTSFHDDWQITVTETLWAAFGGDIMNNDLNAGESFQVFGPGNAQLGSAPTPISPFLSGKFIGVISDEQISRVFYDADAVGDNLDIRNFAYAVVPEPGTVSILLLGGLTLILKGLNRNKHSRSSAAKKGID